MQVGDTKYKYAMHDDVLTLEPFKVMEVNDRGIWLAYTGWDINNRKLWTYESYRIAKEHRTFHDSPFEAAKAFCDACGDRTEKLVEEMAMIDLHWTKGIAILGDIERMAKQEMNSEHSD